MANAPTPRSTAAKWVPDQHLFTLLYHGCVRKDADAMMGGRIDPQLGQPDTDFGRGFYTTTLQRQAEDWAYLKRRKVRSRSSRLAELAPVVVWFKVPRYRLAELESLAFGRGDYEAEEYWSLVQHCRSSLRATTGRLAKVKHHARDSSGKETWYVMVSGPVSAFWQQRTAMMTADQFSFHTVRGAAVLNDLLLRGANDNEYGTISL